MLWGALNEGVSRVQLGAQHRRAPAPANNVPPSQPTNWFTDAEHHPPPRHLYAASPEPKNASTRSTALLSNSNQRSRDRAMIPAFLFFFLNSIHRLDCQPHASTVRRQPAAASPPQRSIAAKAEA